MQKTDLLLLLLALFGVCIIVAAIMYEIYATYDVFVSLSHRHVIQT